MFAYQRMLVSAAQAANISVPEDPETNLSDIRETHPHWFVFCMTQLGAPMPYPGVHFDNAHVVGDLTVEEVRLITMEELLDKGFCVGYSHALM